MIRRSTPFAAILMLWLATAMPQNAAAALSAENSIWVGTYGSISHWRPVARDELILWASPTRPYLVKIWRPHRSLRFVNALGVTKTVGRVTKFDKVVLDGQRIPIKSIRRIDKEYAKALRYRTS